MSAATEHLRMYGFVAGGLLLAAGCIGDKPGDCLANGTLEISPAIAGERITGNGFDPGDRIGLYAAVSSGAPGPENYAANTAYTYDGTRWTATGGSPLPWPGESTLDVWAYWPYDPNLSTEDPRSYPFTVGADQSTTENYKSNDLLWAKATGNQPGVPVQLTFSHLLSRVRINIRASFDAGDGWPQRAHVTIAGLSRQMTIDLSDGTIIRSGSPGGIARNEMALPGRVLTGTAATRNIHDTREEAEITLLRHADTTPGYDATFDAIVMPQEVGADLPLVRITLDGNDYVFMPADDILFVPGESLTINLTLTDRWPGLIFDMNDINWSSSRVWDIYNGTRLIGRVCMEYIFRNSAPRADQIAEVIYPAGDDGRLVLSAGFVARVYNRTPNRTQGRYEYNTAPVHGGSAVFGSSNTLDSYTSGNLPLIGKVRFTPGHIEAASNEETATLRAQPYILTDVDGNNYPIVKIGTQYWIAQNYRAEHYTDGTQLTYYYYNNNPASYKSLYGALYTWNTATAARFAPDGWHLPSRDDWYSMWQYLYPEMGRKIKSLEVWNPYIWSDNASGFSALPGGRRTNTGVYIEMGLLGQWWSSNQINATTGYRLYVGIGANVTETSLNKDQFQSVRLIRGN